MNQDNVLEFTKIIQTYYKEHKRDFLWRSNPKPYYVFVSEVMLQQTQTSRVIPKFEQFITAFPDFNALSSASLQELLFAWQGLGYNRRGLYLQKAAGIIVSHYNGSVPREVEQLETLPGIGKATAGSIAAFAYNLPTIFIETNIRSVFLHFFYPDQTEVPDSELFALIKQAVACPWPQDNPREWYYALMDYGVMLKKTMKNPSRKSKHHVKQSKFIGSNRQIRGYVVKLLTEKSYILIPELVEYIESNRAIPPVSESKINNIIQGLVKDKLITLSENYLSLAQN